MTRKRLLTAAVVLACTLGIMFIRYRNQAGRDSAKQIAVAYALGGKGDQSYNDAVVVGVERLRSRGFDVREYEPPSLDQYRDGLEVLARYNPRVLFCVGYLYDDAVRAVASRYRRTAFVVLDGGVEAENAWSIKFRADEGAELAGGIAAAITKTNKVTFVGGMDIPAINEFRSGYEEGVKATREGIDVSAYYVGATPAAGFTDPVKGLEIGLTAIADGADVAFHAAGTSGNGVIEACKQKGTWAIGVDVDQRHLAPDVVLTSVVKKFDVAIDYFLREYDANQIASGSVITLGYREGAIDITPLDLPPSHPAMRAVEAIRARLSGSSE